MENNKNVAITTDILLQVSNNHEGTAAPYWMIIDPRQMIRIDPHSVANMITGPFFSREEAEEVLVRKAHHYSDHAGVFCMSAHNKGTYSSQYINALERARYAK